MLAAAVAPRAREESAVPVVRETQCVPSPVVLAVMAAAAGTAVAAEAAAAGPHIASSLTGKGTRIFQATKLRPIPASRAAAALAVPEAFPLVNPECRGSREKQPLSTSNLHFVFRCASPIIEEV